MSDRVLVAEPSARSGKWAPLSPDPTTAWVLVAVVGSVLAVIGWTDILLAWYPPKFGTVEWEFGTISATIDSMPLGTMGLAALAASAIARGATRPVRIVGVLCWLIAGVLLGVLALYLLDLPVAWNGVQEGLRPMLGKAMLKTSLLTLAYIGLYGWLGWFTRRRLRVTR